MLMHKFFIRLAVITVLGFTLLPAQAIIIDHTKLNLFEQIPEKYLDIIKQKTIFYAGESHSVQVLSGCLYLEEHIDPKYSIAFEMDFNDTPPDPSTILPAQETPPAHRMANVCAACGDPEEYWDGEAGMNRTRMYASSGLFDYSMYGWCGELSSWDLETEMLNRYCTALDQFEQEFPNMRFIYQTGHLNGTANSKVLEHNEIIRKYCIDNNKVLLDYGDIEAYDPDGNYHGNSGTNCGWCEEWSEKNYPDNENLPPFSSSGIPTVCPHAHGYNCYMKGKAYWVMMAMLAGWDGTSTKKKIIKNSKSIIQLKISPNPSYGSTTILFGSNNIIARKSVSIYDLNGHKIEEYFFRLRKTVWYARNHPPGVYVVKAKIGDEVVDSKKIIVLK